ncbi:hypothetical protein NJD71_00290 [Psychrobacter sp. PP-21]|uniref:hypothetical protein n=1 Tax=Psychrobacter sp. PP-21 TaxID=2957503 RepID=UPI0029BBCE45|nr:hypothetical protein [Psychrobacter sp. PP-21]MDX2372562.1 hypothetical protein [Psychrobacter sp. PP-21]
MSILIGTGIVVTVATFYLGKKGWHALHKAVGITPGVLTYQESNAALSLATISWQQLKLNKKHLQDLPEQQLRQLRNIDNKVTHYQRYQKSQSVQTAQNKVPEVTEQQFVLNKLLQTRLPEMLASHHHLMNTYASTDHASDEKKIEANRLLQKMLDNIEQRLDILMAQIEAQHLQDLKAMNSYMDSHDD